MTDSSVPHRSWHEQQDVLNLSPDSYTAQRLQHAAPDHLHLTSRRTFIGPIPEGWLKSRRQDWYKHHLHINYSSRAATFSIDPKQARQRCLSGLEGPSASALYGHSFPQPDNLEAELEESDNAQEEGSGPGEATANAPSGMLIPRTSTAESGGMTADDDADFVDAPSEPEDEAVPDPMNPSPRPLKRWRRTSTQSFVTASSNPSRESSPGQTPGNQDSEHQIGLNITPQRKSSVGIGSSINRVASSLAPEPTGEETSTSSLLLRTDKQKAQEPEPSPRPASKGIISRVARRSQNGSAAAPVPESGPDDSGSNITRSKSHLRNLVHFDTPADSKRAELHLKAKAAQMTIHRASTKVRRRKIKDGIVVKMERMLIRVDATANDVPDDYDENGNQKIESRTIEKWREYMVVCRQSISEDADFVLQMYKTRVIPAIEQAHTNKRAKFELPLGRKITRVNLYSSLDKSVVVWLPSSKGTKIFILQARTASNAVEWYTFMRTILGWRRANELQISIPDLSISLKIQDPFKKLEASQNNAQVAEEGDEEAILKTMQEEQAVAQNLIKRCMSMIGESVEWTDVLDVWTKATPMGLAWKRYDRLEWIHGANERKMYGTIAMMKSHDLELRPKSHYPTSAITRKKKKTLEEPAPVEGFLIRLTSQRGVNRKLGKLFFKRLYFSSHDQYLVFSRPAKADLPPPPKLPASDNSRVPTAHDIAGNVPLIYTVDPYPVEDGEVKWLAPGHTGTPAEVKLHDRDAQDEADRKAQILLDCDGYINLCNVMKVRKVHKGDTLADEDIESGSDVDFDAEVDDTNQDDGATQEFDKDRTFELVMRNGLIVRLQSYNKKTKKMWIKTLRQLAKYWKLRCASDIALYKYVRHQNLSTLKIDEEVEAYVGQFARKWEVTQSYASPELYNLCGISSCRTIHVSGVLYRKPRIHAAFSRCSVILAQGHLLIFQDVLRSRSGKELAHIHHERVASLDLKDCYIYSGLLTENDLLYQNQTFDNNKPGHHALPRIYLEDGWTSTDEDVMTTFVVWHGKSKGWFRAEEGGGSEKAAKQGKRSKIKRVGKLGTTGRSVVFRARSRAERDRWVLGIQNEIERVQGGAGEDFRITEERGE